MKSFTVNTPLKRGGRITPAGKVVELPEEEARPLLALGAIVPAAVAPAPPPPAEGDDLVAAIAKLDPAREDHWTQGGKPECRALAEIIGRDVSAKERDAAWDAVQAQAKE